MGVKQVADKEMAKETDIVKEKSRREEDVKLIRHMLHTN